MDVIELKHPLVEHKLAILRDKKTGIQRNSIRTCYNALLRSNARCENGRSGNRNSNSKNENKKN